MKLVIVTLLMAVGFSASASRVPVNKDITPNDPLPVRVLDCGGAKITSISDRFGRSLNSEDAMGTNVELNNGGVGVDYELVQAIKDSKVGDHVLVCLVFIPNPDECPPGDERGRIYTMTNLRTLQSWTLPDSQHGCGGA